MLRVKRGLKGAWFRRELSLPFSRAWHSCLLQQSYVSSFPPSLRVWLHPFLERNKLLAFALTQAPSCPVPDGQQLSREKTSPVEDICYFIKVAVFSMFNSCGWAQGTADNIKWTLHSTGVKFPLSHVYRALQAIVSSGAHFSITYIFFKLSSLAKNEFWDNMPFYPETEWMHQQKKPQTLSHGYRGDNSKDHPICTNAFLNASFQQKEQTFTSTYSKPVLPLNVSFLDTNFIENFNFS